MSRTALFGDTSFNVSAFTINAIFHLRIGTQGSFCGTDIACVRQQALESNKRARNGGHEKLSFSKQIR